MTFCPYQRPTVQGILCLKPPQQNRLRKEVLPTPESPISTILTRSSQGSYVLIPKNNIKSVPLLQNNSTTHLLISFSTYFDRIMPKLKGKQIKDYTFGDCLVEFEQGSQIAKAHKSSAMNLNLTVYGISNSLIEQSSFVAYNEDVVNNSNQIYPNYYEIVRSQNFLYMIFEQLVRPHVNIQSMVEIQRFALQIQKIYCGCQYKIIPQQIFSKTAVPGELCIIPQYTKSVQKSSNNMYSKFHNKSMLTEFFCSLVPVTDKHKVSGIFMQNIQNNTLILKLQPYLKVFTKTPTKQTQQAFQNHPQTFFQPPKLPSSNNPPKPNNEITKSNANKLLKQMQDEYPQIDDKQFEQLMNYVHVNPSLKQQAGQAYMRQSVENRKQEAGNQINQIVDNIHSSLFNVTKMKSKSKGKSSTVEIKLNLKKLDVSQFQVHFQVYYSQFGLFKKAIRSYLEKYKQGFSGIIAAYFLALIGILKKLKMYTDLTVGQDIFEIGGQISSMNYNKYLNILKQDLAKEARALVSLKSIIQNASMPYKTYQALMPYLEQDLELVSLEQAQNFSFFYMTVLQKMDKQRIGYHEIIALEVMYIMISPMYSIVYSEEDMPKEWDKKYYQLKKVLISALVPTWTL